MTINEVRRCLEAVGLIVKDGKRNGNNTGDELRFTTGEIVTVYDNGTITPQGKNPSRVREILGIDDARPVVDGQPGASRKVFIVYGHDQHARTQLEAMLLRWELEPLILDQLPSEGQTLIEKLEKYAQKDVAFAVVLATPDDEGNIVGRPDERKQRARQNVVLELGILLAKLGRFESGDLVEKPRKDGTAFRHTGTHLPSVH